MMKIPQLSAHPRISFRTFLNLSVLILVISLFSSPLNKVSAQQPATKEINGKVTDSRGQPVVGVSVMVKGTTVGKTTDFAGKFQFSVPVNATMLTLSFTGMKEQQVIIGDKGIILIKMLDEAKGLDEVVFVGYGVQRKESVVGAISTTTNKDLVKRGGAVNLASALSGQLPGVSIAEVTGEPGKEDPTILIRGQSTWNEASPLVLVDGIERRMNDISVSEVQSITVLKDASATAVYGVKGANGVILVTTKRGQLGKAKLDITVANTFKTPSRVTGLMESYSARQFKNAAIEREVPTNQASWSFYTPNNTLFHYKQPQSEEDKYLYPNENWPDIVLKKFTTDQNVNINVSGGTPLSKYFASISYVHQGDILNSPGDKGYDPSFIYNRLNFRGNLDFQLTPTTTLFTNLSGHVAQKSEPNLYSNYWIFRSIYNLAPDAFVSQYPDGYYGRNPFDLDGDGWNPLASLNNSGVKKTNSLFIGNDIRLDQKLDFLTKGLSTSAIISFDNTYGSQGPNIVDGTNQGQVLYKYVDPITKKATYIAPSGAISSQGYDVTLNPYAIINESVTNAALQRNLYYRLTVSYARSFKKSDVSGLFLFSRNKSAIGETFPSFREDWVGRATYAYDGRYFIEANGAYNGSEKFGPGYRFGFFPSIGAGWMLSKESFLDRDWLSKLKLRANIGKVGSDAGIPRWGYLSSWTTGGQANFGNNNNIINPISAMYSPYTNFAAGTIANVDINWETAIKIDIGIEATIFQNKLSLEADYFKDNRNDIFMSPALRNIPAYFGAPPVAINLGKTMTKGFEIDLTYKDKFSNGVGYYVRTNITKAKDIVLKAEDPLYQPAYLKTAGFAIGQTKTQQIGSLGNTWNDVYAQTALATNSYKLPGDFDIIDFNGDGRIDGSDAMAYGYQNNRPMNTYSTFLGLDYKSFSFMVQFYGVNNMTRSFYQATPKGVLRTEVNVGYKDYWTPTNTDASFRAPRLLTDVNSPNGNFSYFDASYLRLKTVEIAYQASAKTAKKLGLSSLKIYINGNNLIFWSKVPNDVESGSFIGYNANSYPVMKQVQVGMNIGL